ncbi:MAG: OmpA family protein, partial [Ferruginibacter sp.]|nr:OmpA family protein [Ferruginibacter sp.]
MKNLFILLLSLFILSQLNAQTVPVRIGKAASQLNISQRPPTDLGLIIIPFEYRQSALYVPHTFMVIDSVANLLFKNKGITLSVFGYAHFEEGNDTIKKYLALDRALFVRDYILGRGVNENRLLLIKGMGATKSGNSDVDKDGHSQITRVELILNYPPPPPPIIYDRDEDGIADSTDTCADEFGYLEKNGCPDKDAIMIPFENKGAWLASKSYSALNNVVKILQANPLYNIRIEGHAYKTEGVTTVCNALAAQRASMVVQYFLSRNILTKRITT